MNNTGAKKYKILILNAIFLFAILLAMFLLNLFYTDNNSKHIIFIISWIGNISFISCLLIYVKISGRWISPYVVFLLTFYVFQFGQFISYSFNAEYSYFFENAFYLGTFGGNLKLVVESQSIFLAGMILFNFGATIVVYNHDFSVNAPKAILFKDNLNKVNSFNNKAFYQVAKIFFFVSFIPAFYLKISELSIALTNGYIGTYDSDIGKFFSVMEIFFIPSLLMLLICVKNKTKIVLVITIILLYASINFLIGGRTDAMSIIVVLLIFYFIKRKKRLKIGSVLFLLAVGYLGACLAVSVAEFRGETNKSIVDLFLMFVQKIFSFNVVFDFLGELGWTGIALPATMYYIDGSLGYGISYLSSILGIIPTSFDFLGIVSSLEHYSTLDVWLTNCMGLSFGSGFSLSAEAFYNFGYFSPIFMMILGVILGKILYIDFNNISSLTNFAMYSKMVMLYSLLTLSRRMSIHLVDSFFYYVVVVFFVYKLVIWIQKGGSNPYVKKIVRRGE